MPALIASLHYNDAVLSPSPTARWLFCNQGATSGSPHMGRSTLAEGASLSKKGGCMTVEVVNPPR